ncbi:MAG: transglutaminase-like domain-containing protein [Nanoarchaeota archaeon]
MKKLLVTALFYATFGNCSPNYAPPPTLDSSIKQINTPEETQQWLETVLTYESDKFLYGKEDFWAPCGLTYQHKKGDCEDYAICAAAILREDIDLGYIITVYNSDSLKREAHAVFAYRLNGKWGIISNDKNQFRSPKYQSLPKVLLDSIDEKYTEYMVYDYGGLDLVDGKGNLGPKMKEIGRYRLR